jgi:GntR family transcriptional regulator
MPAIPLAYAEIAEDLAARIRSGEYQPGDKLPSYKGIGELYSVLFSTAARAVALLRDRGLVVGAPGRGVFVADPTQTGRSTPVGCDPGPVGDRA